MDNKLNEVLDKVVANILEKAQKAKQKKHSLLAKHGDDVKTGHILLATAQEYGHNIRGLVVGEFTMLVAGVEDVLHGKKDEVSNLTNTASAKIQSILLQLQNDVSSALGGDVGLPELFEFKVQTGAVVAPFSLFQEQRDTFIQGPDSIKPEWFVPLAKH